MSWHFSRALVEAYSEECSSGGEQSAPSKSNPTPSAYLCKDRMTAFSRLSRFGMTFVPLTESRGAELLTWYLAGFPVRTFQQQEKAQGSPENVVDSGKSLPGSLAKYDPDSALWKTHQYSLLGDLTLFSETWPRWGTMQDGECFLLPTLEHATSERGYGYLPTPNKTVVAESMENVLLRKQRYKQGLTNFNPGFKLEHVLGGIPNPTWTEWHMGWVMTWTDLQPLEMDKFQQWLDLHGTYSAKD